MALSNRTRRRRRKNRGEGGGEILTPQVPPELLSPLPESQTVCFHCLASFLSAFSQYLWWLSFGSEFFWKFSFQGLPSDINTFLAGAKGALAPTPMLRRRNPSLFLFEEQAATVNLV